MPQYDHLTINEQFLSHIGFLALIGNKGPYRSLLLNEHINNVKVIDNPADIVAGDIAYGGNRNGIVQSNVLNANKRTITVKYGPIEKPSDVSAEDWAADYDTLAFVIEKHVISVVEDTNATGTVHHNPYDRIASVGAVFARKVDVINNPAEYGTIELLTDPEDVVFGEGKSGSIIFSFSEPGVSVQKYVDGVASGAPVVADGDGYATFSLNGTEGDEITFVASKTGFNNLSYGPFVVEEGIKVLAAYSKDGAADNTIVGVTAFNIADDNWFVRFNVPLNSMSYAYSAGGSGNNNFTATSYSNVTAGRADGDTVTVTAVKTGYTNKVFGPYSFTD